MSILDKKQMTEEDIKLNFITPAIKAKGWDGKITMETKITDGRINLKGNIASREAPKKPITFCILIAQIRLPWWKQKIITTAFLSVCNRQNYMLKCST